MNKAPAFQFYPSDFLSDENVMLMSNQEVGCYIKLLCFCWKQGSIPDDIDKIAKLCGEDSSAMAQLWESLRLCFSTSITEGRLTNKRLEKERKKQANFRLERSESGKKGAAKRWKKQENKDKDGSANKQPLANDSSSSSSSSSDIKKKNKKKKRFIPPKIDEVKVYFDEKGYTVNQAEKFFEYYDSGNWKDSKGNSVISWRQKALAVWMKDEGKQQKQSSTPQWL